MQFYVWKLLPEQGHIAPVGRRLLSVQQTSLRKNQGAAASRIDLRPLRVHAHEPVEQPPIELPQTVGGIDDDVGNEHNIRAGHFIDARLRHDADAGAQPDRAWLRGHDARFE